MRFWGFVVRNGRDERLVMRRCLRGRRTAFDMLILRWKSCEMRVGFIVMMRHLEEEAKKHKKEIKS